MFSWSRRGSYLGATDLDVELGFKRRGSFSFSITSLTSLTEPMEPRRRPSPLLPPPHRHSSPAPRRPAARATMSLCRPHAARANEVLPCRTATAWPAPPVPR